MKTATYHYRTYNYQGGYIPHTMRVEIIGESAKSYHVKYLEFHANGSRPGTLSWVRKDKLKIDQAAEVRPAAQVEVRLPYKEN